MDSKNRKISLLDKWKKSTKSKLAPNTIYKAPNGVKTPLSSGQQRLWFLQQLYPNNTFYNASTSLELNGNLDDVILKKSIVHLINQNDILKSNYQVVDGTPTIIINTNFEVIVDEINFSNLSEEEKNKEIHQYCTAQAKTIFNLSNGPLFKISLLKKESEKHVLFFTFHHIIIDQWSIGLLKKEIASSCKLLSSGQPLSNEKKQIQYTDYVHWQRNRLIEQSQVAFWKEKLSGDLPILDLQTDRKHPVEPSFKGRIHKQEFSENFSNKILSCAQSLEVTPFVLLLSAYNLLLTKHTAQQDIIIGTPISVRNDSSLENLLGFFVETVVIRTHIDPNIGVLEFVKEVRGNILEAFENKDVPFDELVKALNIERSIATNPIFQTMFVYDSDVNLLNFGDEVQVSNDFEFESGASKFDLTLFVVERNGKLSLKFEYATDIFEETTIIRFQEHLKLVLEEITTNSDRKINEVSLLTLKEKEFFLRSNPVKESSFENFKGIHQIIFDFAKTTPTATAAIYQEKRISYKEAYDRAVALEPLILEYSKGENKIIGLALNRSVDIVTGILAILNAGCAYLPIDTDYPQQRIDYMLEDAQVGLVLTQEIFASEFKTKEVSTISLDAEIPKSNSGLVMPREANEEDVAYVIYTSGSSGKPKGVPITHKNIINSTEGRLAFYNQNPTVFLLMSSIAFDSSKAGIFWTLCTGGSLLISEKRIEQDIEKLCDIIATENVSHTLMLPSLYKVLLEYGEVNKLDKLQTIIVAGESCQNSLVSAHFDKLSSAALYNEYGPTEASVWCTAHKLRKENSTGTVPIGQPVANASIFLFDKSMQLVPYGAVGEIYVGGPGLSGKYINRPDLTEKAYVKNPLSIQESEVLYKTGDNGRYSINGDLEFLGRSDQQIKIRGFRVELEEIEQALVNNSMIAEAVVLLIEKEASSSESENKSIKRLVAYITTNETYNQNELKHDLKKEVPDYMVPSSFIEVAEIPHLPNGKIDKKALQKIKASVDEKKSNFSKTPVNEIQRKLVEIWEDVLNYSPVYINDNFFELGGDSISSIQIIAKARKMGMQLKANQLFDSQTIAELALFARTEPLNTNSVEILTGEVPLTPIQHWFFDEHRTAPHYWNHIVRITNIESIPVSIIESVTKELISYHDVLRLSFSKIETEWTSRIMAPKDIKGFYSFNVVNADNKEHQDAQIDEIMISLQQKCTLADGNLFKTLYFDCGTTQKNKIFFVAHHLVIDMVSWNTIFEDFSTAIEQSLSGIEVGFKIKTSNVRAWGDYLQDLSNSEEVKDEIAFWNSQFSERSILPKDFEIKPGIFIESSIKKHKSTISIEDSAILLSTANNAFKTKIEDLMITSLVIAVCDWTELENFSVGLERTGRNMANDDIDVSNTVGWFTSFFPMKFEKPRSGDIGDLIKSVKENLRAIPNEGIGYGILKYLAHEKEQFDFTKQNPQLIFNYLGGIGGGYGDSEIRYEFQGNLNKDPLNECSSAIAMNVFVDDGHVTINWNYNAEVYQDATFFNLVENYTRTLKKVIIFCSSKIDAEYTPSDFPEADLDQDDLDELMKLL